MAATDGAGPAADGRESGQYLQVQTTTDSRAEAMALTRAAVEARLAACGQVAGPVASTYWWNDEVEQAEEWLVFLKLPADRYQALAAFLSERHSYDEPEIIATPIVAGAASFLSWVTDETRAPGRDIPLQRDPASAAESSPAESSPAESSPADVPGQSLPG
jgi:periplasmic divalent cation tolerance protein